MDGRRYLESVVSSQPYVVGDSFTMADITAFAGLAYVDFVELDFPGDCTNLIAWRQCVAARPSIAG